MATSIWKRYFAESLERGQMERKWSSGGMFLLAAVGSAVGLANIWRFPYVVGANGGGAFVLIYILSMFLVTIPLLVAEIVLGRRGGGDPVITMRRLAEESGLSRAWGNYGWLSLFTTLTILSFYSVISGWSLAYIPKMLTGLAHENVEGIQREYALLTAGPGAMIFWHGVFMVFTTAIIARGLNRGIESAVKFLMPVLFLTLIVLLIYGFLVGDMGAAMRYLFTPDFSKLNFQVVLMAVGSSFFSASVGVGAMMTYGAYLPRSVSVWGVATGTVVIDLAVSLVAGLAIFSIIFANGLDADSGPGLMFLALPLAFSQISGGILVGLLFFVLLFLAALTSAFSLLEPTVLWLNDRYRVSRAAAAWGVGFVVWLAGFATVFSFNLWKDVHLLSVIPRFHDSSILDLLDFLVTNLLLPAGGLALAIFTGWRVARSTLREELGAGTGSIVFALWIRLVRYLVPVALLALFVGNLV